jgi:hypothetical protein
MANIAQAGALNVAIHATSAAQIPVWSAPESWPIHLGYGVTFLASPGLSFTGATGSQQVLFQVDPYGVTSADSLTVTIGSQAGGVAIGFDPSQDGTGTATAIEANGVNLQITGVELNGTQAAVVAGDGRQTITFGPSPVMIHGYSNAQIGIDLQGGSVTDVGSSRGPALVIAGLQTDILAEGGDATFSRPILLGSPPDGDGDCPSPKSDGYGINFSQGNSVVTLLGGGTIQCDTQDGISFNGGDGIAFVGNDGGTPTGASTSISHAGCSGAYVGTGALYASNVTFADSHYGVIQRDEGRAGIGSGAALPSGGSCTACVGNAVGCTNPNEPGYCQYAVLPTIDLWDNSPDVLHAEGVTLLAVAAADYVCANGGEDVGAMTGCSCSGSACVALSPDQSPPNGAPTVTSSNSTSTPATTSLVNTTGFSLNPTCP